MWNQSGPVRYEDLLTLLPERMPVLRDACHQLGTLWQAEKPPTHVLYGDVFNPHVRALIDGSDQGGLREAFDFIELLASSSDDRVNELTEVTICEYLAHLPDAAARVRHLMGPRTAILLQRALLTRKDAV